MSYDFAPRITLPWSDLSGVVQFWEERCKKLAVYEHEADDTVAKTHCHFLMLGCDIQEEALKRMFKAHYPSIKVYGNAFWSWTRKYPPSYVNLTYYSKGHISPSYLHVITPAECEEARLKWIALQPEEEALRPSSKKYDEYQHLKTDILKREGCRDMTLDAVRTFVFAWYYHRDGKIPPATQYKRMAGSLYVWLNERTRLNFALQEVQNLWY